MFKRLILLLIFLTPFSLICKEYIFPFFSFNEEYYGYKPLGTDLVLVDGYLYGTTFKGGIYNSGTIFKMKRDGTDYRVIHNFTKSRTTIKNGNPLGRLCLDNGYIYGVCGLAQDNFGGTVYRIKTDGTEFKILADFYDGSGNYIYGFMPLFGGVILVDGVLYGTTYMGGSNNLGVIFSLNTNGSNFRVVHNFTKNGELGYNCFGGLVHSEGKLYGATKYGGVNNKGVIFSIKPDGADLKAIHHNTSSYGEYIEGSLTIIDDVIYISAGAGGVYGRGTIFSIRTDGSNLKVLHAFNQYDGLSPGSRTGLLKLGDYLYGTTFRGGENDFGVLFRIKPDGTDFEVLDHFSEIKGKGRKGGLIYDPPYIYGSAYSGGTRDNGSIYRYYIGDVLSGVVTYTPEVGLTTAKLWGNAYKKDGFDILEKGFCWGESNDPDMDDNVKVAGKDEGKFVADIYSLNPGKTYYVRAYVKTSMGTFYGECKSFRSPHPKVSGTILMDGKPVAGVVVDFVGREKLVTGDDGTFSTEVYYGWSGKVVISKEGVKFTRSEFSYTNLKENVTIEVNGSPKDKE